MQKLIVNNTTTMTIVSIKMIVFLFFTLNFFIKNKLLCLIKVTLGNQFT